MRGSGTAARALGASERLDMRISGTAAERAEPRPWDERVEIKEILKMMVAGTEIHA